LSDWGRRSGGGSAVAGANETQDFADRDDVTFAAVDARQDTVFLGGDVEVDLVGLQLDQAVTASDSVALLLQPGSDDRVDERLAQRWNPYLDRHRVNSAPVPIAL
jgi:hypothetical protein